MNLYDPACYELAENFLPDGSDHKAKDALAMHIQEAVESWLGALDAYAANKEGP